MTPNNDTTMKKWSSCLEFPLLKYFTFADSIWQQFNSVNMRE